MEGNMNIKEHSHFIMTACKLLTEQRKTLIYTVAGYLGISIVLGLFFGYLGIYPSLSNSMLYIFLAGLACAYAASRMMFELTSKEGRISLLMSPDSAATKFIVRLIGILPGMLLLVAVGYLAYAYSALLSNGLSHGVWLSLSNPFKEIPNEIWGVLGSFYLFFEAAFIFGAVVWPRKSFIKTVGLLSLLQIVLIFLMIAFFRVFKMLGWSIQIVDEDALFRCFISVIIAISAAIIFSAYYKFKRIAVV